MSVAPATTGSGLSTLVPLLPQRPRRVIVDLWNWCNFQCLHCSQSSGPHEARESLPLAAFEQIVTDALAAGAGVVTLAGGEPTLHPALTRYLEAGRKAGMPMGIITNGWVVDETYARRLFEAGCRDAALSVYGGSAAIHDTVTRSPGSFERLAVAAAALHAADIGVRVIFVVTSLSVRELREPSLWRFLQRLDPAWVRVVAFLPTGRGAFHEAALSPDPLEYIASREALGRWVFPFRVSMSRMYDPAGVAAMRCGEYFGLAPAVMHDGSLRPCCTLSGDANRSWTRDDLAAQSESTACRHLPRLAGTIERHCPLAEVEFPVGNALTVASR